MQFDNVLGKGIYLKHPSEEECKNIEKSFCDRWDFPNYVGASDGKHIRVHLILVQYTVITRNILQYSIASHM